MLFRPLLCCLAMGMAHSFAFPNHQESRFLVLITHQWSCDSDAEMHRAIESLKEPLNVVDMLSIRVRRPENPDQQHVDRVRTLIRSIMALQPKCRVVVSSDWMDIGMEEHVHGIHFKEAHRNRIASIPRDAFVVGTSAHTIESALEAAQVHKPDYFICGTCYPTESHPEKDIVEGPELPALVKQALLQQGIKTPVIAIGGLDASNVKTQVRESSFVPGVCADGVAVIRGILDAGDPGAAAHDLRRHLS